MNDYCITPPFVAQTVPPLVMFEVSRDHKLYFAAYNDGVDLNDDDRIDTTYDHSIEYYGYFNPYKCYTHSGGATHNDYFTPVATTTDRFCASGQWGGSILNWLTMSRMDVIRKVMYGGQRSKEAPVLLNRAFIPQDAHSWGKEYTGKLCSDGTDYKQMCSADGDCDAGYTCQDKSLNLIGIIPPFVGTACSTTAVTWGTVIGQPGYGKMLVVRYPNTNGTTDTNHDSLLSAFDYTQFFAGFTPTFVTDFSNTILDPSKDHGNDYAQIVVTEFKTLASAGNWQFAIDGDDGVEMEIRDTSSGNILQSTDNMDQLGWYGGHGWCSTATTSCYTHTKTWTLAANTWYRLIVRHTEGAGNDGVKVWFKNPGNLIWRLFGGPTLEIRAPNIITSVGSDNNTCTLKNSTFLDTGTPTSTGVIGQQYHLFCNTTLSTGAPTSTAASQTTLLRRITDTKHRIWEWSLKERPVCDDTFQDNTSAITNRTDFTVQAEVCKSGVGTRSEKDKFERCRNYGGVYTAATDTYTGGTWMPIGLFQKYGEYNRNDTSGVTKVCSKSMNKSCSSDNDCAASEGLCFDKAQMYFGVMTTSYTKNLSGGVLRKNPGPVSDEIDMSNGKLVTTENSRGNLIHTMDRLVVVDYDYGTHSYPLDYNGRHCGWIWNRPMVEGECRNWGNPLAEMMYESLRYFVGKGVPTVDFNYDTADDTGVLLSKPIWGYTKGGMVYQPYDIFPICSKPFILLISDVNTSYDADKIPGSSYAPIGLLEDTAYPHLRVADKLPNGNTELNDLMATISATEGINDKSWFIGESMRINSAVDFLCTSKTADTTLGLRGLRGICPEEPTKQGSYYAAAVAYYGRIKTKPLNIEGKEITVHDPVSTFVVALSSPFADINIKAGDYNVKIVPVGKTVSGLNILNCLGYNNKCALDTDAIGRLILKDCDGAFCPTNGLVGWFINDIKYNSDNEIIYMKFRQNFEDAEQGADYDMDAIVTYEICTKVAATARYGSCGGLTLDYNDLQVSVTSTYGAGSADQILGYIISGTDKDGTYLVVRDKDVPSTSPVYTFGVPLVSKLKFTSSSTSLAGNLKDPLWYAAKWGGFTGEGIPDTESKWDKDGTGIPDNYYPVNNPLELDQKLESALQAILERVASGTAASMLNNSEGSGANLLQALFFPKKVFYNSTEANWIGELHNLWYYLDPDLQRSSIREDTDQDFTLNLKNDRISAFYFDPGDDTTKVNLYSDANGDGVADNLNHLTVFPEDVHSLWKAGRMLWNRDVTSSPRNIYTGYNSSIGNQPQTISSLAATTGFQDLLQIPLPNGATRNTATTALINYINGIDQAGMRGRKVSIDGCLLDTCTREWKLGDIISSSPKQISNIRLNSYSLMAPTGYGDTTYQTFVNSDAYKHRGMVFAGGNDGMLHAFKSGILKELSERYTKAMMTNLSGVAATAQDLLGNEEWAFIPKNSLPYLKYLTDLNYGHLYFVDKTVSTLDASIGVNNAACQADYSQCIKDASSWRTVLVGGMGIGGAVKPISDPCTAPADCVKTPIADYGYSSYFALDVTDPAAPKYLWEISPAGLGFSTTGPALVRIATKNAAGTGPDHTKNGKWFAVFASGPTGPIDTSLHEFKGQSDQELKIFIVDLATGTLVKTINTGILNAFAGSMASSWIDTDRSNPASTGYYSDDAVYIGYVKKDTLTGTWTKGGIGRLSTRESSDPASADATKQWAWSILIDNTGAVTTSISKLQDRRNKNLWIYFGTGRYFYKEDDNALTSQNVLYGVREPCYSTNNDIDQNCTAAVPSGLIDQSGDTPSSTIAATAPGWYINLDAQDVSHFSERLITDPIASPAGAVFFTTFKPSRDICKYGGDSFIWSANYATGGAPLAAAMKGDVLMQVSTGAFVEIPLASSFTAKGGRRTNTPISGMPPPAQGLSLITSPPPVKKFLHVREK